VWREGHNHVSASEREAALNMMLSWIKHKTAITVRHRNVLVEGVNEKRPLFQRNNTAFVSLKVNPVHNSLHANILPDDLKQLGITQGKWYNIQYKNKTIDVYYGTYPFTVAIGSWISYDHPDGYLVVNINANNQLNNAAAQLGVVDGAIDHFIIGLNLGSLKK